MLTLFLFAAVAAAFNLVFFIYAATKMKSRLNPLLTTGLSLAFNIPLSLLIAMVYSSLMLYAVMIGASEEWIWEYMEEGEPSEE
jgi:dolichyl-phosphate-mannose--protein O-mannosyl transferase